MTDDQSSFAFVGHISYVGGDGNDVTLTPLNVAARFTSVQRFADGDALKGERAGGERRCGSF